SASSRWRGANAESSACSPTRVAAFSQSQSAPGPQASTRSRSPSSQSRSVPGPAGVRVARQTPGAETRAGRVRARVRCRSSGRRRGMVAEVAKLPGTLEEEARAVLTADRDQVPDHQPVEAFRVRRVDLEQVPGRVAQVELG